MGLALSLIHICVQHRHLDRARTLIGFIDGKVEWELRKAVAPLKAALQRLSLIHI